MSDFNDEANVEIIDENEIKRREKEANKKLVNKGRLQGFLVTFFIMLFIL